MGPETLKVGVIGLSLNGVICLHPCQRKDVQSSFLMKNGKLNLKTEEVIEQLINYLNH